MERRPGTFAAPQHLPSTYGGEARAALGNPSHPPLGRNAAGGRRGIRVVADGVMFGCLNSVPPLSVTESVLEHANGNGKKYITIWKKNVS